MISIEDVLFVLMHVLRPFMGNKSFEQPGYVERDSREGYRTVRAVRGGLGRRGTINTSASHN